MASSKGAVNPGWGRYGRLTYHPGVRCGDMLFLSGQMGIDQGTGKVVGEGEVVVQTRKAYENIGLVLQAAGLGFGDVVKTVDYITPVALEDYGKTGVVRQEFFGSSFPASTGVIINSLLRREALIEIMAIAMRSQDF